MIGILIVGETKQQSARTLELLANENAHPINGMKGYEPFFITYENAHTYLQNLQGVDVVIFDDLHIVGSPNERAFLPLSRICEAGNIPIICTAYDTPEVQGLTGVPETICRLLGRDLSTELFIASDTDMLKPHLRGQSCYCEFAKDSKNQPRV